jgi:alkylated DNA repair dioxygenase AlkB
MNRASQPPAAHHAGGVAVDPTPVVVHIKHVGQELYDALSALTEQIPAKSRSPRELARTLNVHRTLAGRLLNAIRTDDPLAAISRMPRSEGLRMIIRAARSTVSEDAIDRAEAALGAFEQVVHTELGGWDGFDAAITEWLPDARQRFELANKQLAFKGMANLMGVRADVQLDTAIYYPEATGRRCDIALIEGLVNLRRLRPSARVSIAAHTPSPRAPQPLEYLLEDEPQDQAGGHYPLLRSFCSSPCPTLEAIQTGDMTNYVLAGNEIGANSAVDVFAANVVRGGRPLYRVASDPPVRPHWSAGVNLPAKTLLMNILLHEDVWPGVDPQLLVYDMHVRGLASPGDPSREFDRIDTVESIQPLGKGASRFRASEVGRHVEIVQHVCDKLGWNSDRLRGYRVRVQYPLLNAQYCIAFDPPPLRADETEGR